MDFAERQALEFQRTNAFKAPPKKWADHKLEQLIGILNLNTKASALALKNLLETIELEPVAAECTIQCGKVIQNRPFYMAYRTIDTLILLDEYKSTNWSLLRRGWDSNPRCTFMHTRFPSVLNRPL